MRRKGGYSWLTAFKKAFTFTSNNPGKKPEVDDEAGKKREKLRWSFRKSKSREKQVQAKPSPPPPPPLPEKMYDSELDMSAEEVEFLPREYYAAVIIQTLFRGYLARRALRALKGLVTLQALVRGRNVRRKTNMFLQSMQSLHKKQDKISPSPVAAPYNGHKSSLSCADNFWDYSSMKSREGSIFAGDWRRCHRRLDQIQANMKREESDSYAFSYQNRRSDCNLYNKEEETPEMTLLDQWMASRTSISSRSRGRFTTNHHLSSPIHRSPATPSVAARSPRTPNYMSTTESSKARLRSRSVPRQSPERDGPPTARKRLSFPAPEAHSRNRVWSPRCAMMGRQMSNVSSSVAESFGGEVSPTSTADFRRWLR